MMIISEEQKRFLKVCPILIPSSTITTEALIHCFTGMIYSRN